MKIICPYHSDTRPSMEVYPDGYGHCFSCGVHIYIGGENVKKIKKYCTNMESELARIQHLPIKRIRGLRFHAEDSGAFYIVWPDKTYYKRRNLSQEVRYLAPRGVKPPIFLYPGNEHLIVIEGEINCMSAKSVYKGPKTLCSPGAATQFTKFLDLYKTYESITLVLDFDAAGVAYGEETKEKILKFGRHCISNYVTCDYNHILVEGGPKALIAELRDVI
jgi:hypothetical protein